MSAIAILGALLLGALVGGVSGLVGIGGGALLIPALVFFYGMTQIKAQGTSIATLLLPIGILAFWTYYKSGNVDLNRSAGCCRVHPRRMGGRRVGAASLRACAAASVRCAAGGDCREDGVREVSA
jgi:hypothetical protein